MRVYVAGGSDERITHARAMIDRLTKCGIIITHDWTRCEGYGRESSENERRCWAMQDIEGVRSADVVWVMVPDRRSEGSACELGAALALGKRVIVSGPHVKQPSRIFCLLAEDYATHEEAFAEIVASVE